MYQISYVIPTLNSAATLDMTLLCLHSQKNINVNVIVVDSGSTDGTLDICQRWNVEVLYAEPGNIYRAINVGLRECNTEWLGYINSDDWVYPDSLTRLIAKGNLLNTDVIYGNCDFTDAYGRFIYSFAPPKPNQLSSVFKTGRLGFAQQSAIFRYHLYQKLEGFNQEYYLSADKEFYVRAFNSGASFVYLSGTAIACFRLHENQLSNKQAELMLAEGKKIKSEIMQKASFYDWFVTGQWKFSNMRNYLLRLLRRNNEYIFANHGNT